MRFLIRVIVNAFAIWVVTLIPALQISVDPIDVGWEGTISLIVTLLIVAAIFAIVNTIVGTVIRVVAFPIYILTLGLISFIVNGFLLWLTAWLTHWWSWGLREESFWWGVVAAVIISLINWIFGIFLRPQRDRRTA